MIRVAKTSRRFRPSELQRLASREERRLRGAFLRAIPKIKAALLAAPFTSAINAGLFGDAWQYVRNQSFANFFAAEFDLTIRESALEGSRTILSSDLKSKKLVEIKSLDMFEPRLQSYISQTVGALITKIDTQTQERVREILRRGLNENLHPRNIIDEIQLQVGLTERQSEIIRKTYYEKLSETGSRDKAMKAAERRENQLLKYRADMIARTEAHSAVNAGRQAMARQLVEEGAVEDLQKQWFTSLDERTCEICAPMHSKTIPLNDSFVLPDGSFVDAPPAHPNCRCSIIYSEANQ